MDKLQIENDKVSLQKVGFSYCESLHEVERWIMNEKTDGTREIVTIISNEFRERFARGVAELIIREWDRLVFDERHEHSESGNDLTSTAYVYMLIKKVNDSK